jgi:branched-chain amino acid transport system permease protein
MTTFIDYLLSGISSGMIIALMALALVLIWRGTRVVNFAQVGQAMFTTFIALSLQTLTGNWFLALFGAIAAGAILGLIVQYLVLRPVRRLDTAGAIIATFGVLIALQAAAGMIFGGANQGFPQPFSASGVEVFGRVWPISPYDFIVIGITALMVLILSFVFTRTSLGLGMRASAFNPEVARLSGVNVNRMLSAGWAIAGIVGAVAGVLVAPVATISPSSFDILLVFAFTAAVIGGLDSMVGAISVGIFTGLIFSIVSGYGDASNAPIVALILLILNLLFKPEGIFSHHKAREV